MLTFNNNSFRQPQTVDTDHNWIGRIELMPLLGVPQYTSEHQRRIGQFAVSSQETGIQQISLGVRQDTPSLALVCRLGADSPSAAITTLVDAVYGGLLEAEILPSRTAISRFHIASVQELLHPCGILQSADHQYTDTAVAAYGTTQAFYDDLDTFIS